METIRLHRNAVLWSATFSDPEVVQLFGTDTIPTPYRAHMPAEFVCHQVQIRNPGCRVVVTDDQPSN